MTDESGTDTDVSRTDADVSGTDADVSGTDTDGCTSADSERTGTADESASTTSSRLDRRTLLRTGVVGVAAALAGCSGGDSDDDTDDQDPDRDEDGTETDETDGPDEPPDETSEIPHAEEYGTVVDVVADADADPEGEESIVPMLEARAGDDTLLYFPPGEYLMDGLWTLPAFEHLGLVGEDATVTSPQDYFGYLFIFGLPDAGASDLLFEGIDFDFTTPNTAPRPIQAQIDDGLTVRDVSVAGTSGTARFDVTTSDGSGTVTRLEMPDGMEIVENLEIPEGGGNPDGVGVLVGPANRGRIRFEDCQVSGFPGNGLYASPSNGPIEVIGGTYANNGIASVRVSSPATVRDVTVRCDEAPEGFENMRGIRLRHGESATVENCRIVMEELTYADGGLVIEQRMQSATIRDVEIDCSVDDVPAVNVKSPSHDAEDVSLEFENVAVTGDSGQGSAVQVRQRANCRLESMDIQQSGAARDGVHLIRTTDSALRNSEIDVTGDPLVLEESQLRRTNNRL